MNEEHAIGYHEVCTEEHVEITHEEEDLSVSCKLQNSECKKVRCFVSRSHFRQLSYFLVFHGGKKIVAARDVKKRIRTSYSTLLKTPGSAWPGKGSIGAKLQSGSKMTRKLVSFLQTWHNNGVRLTQLWVTFRVKLTDFRVIVDPEFEFCPNGPFPGQFLTLVFLECMGVQLWQVGETRGVFHKAFFFVINNKNVNGQFFFVIGGKLLSMTKFCFINANDKSRSRKCILIVVIDPNNKIVSSD